MMNNTDPCGFFESDCRVTWRPTLSEMHKIWKLRADVFCRELKWVGTDACCEEWDEFDAGSVPIAVIDKHNEVVGAVRLIMFDKPWMLDTVFRDLVPSVIGKSSDVAEVSRLLVVQKARNVRSAVGPRICDLLYKGIYAYCEQRSIRYLYMVTSDVVLRHLQRTGLPCKPIGVPRRMPDGVTAMTVLLDWRTLVGNPALVTWYNSGWRDSPERSRLWTSGPISRHVSNNHFDENLSA